MVPPPGATDQVTLVESPGAVPVTVAWKLIVPPGVADATVGSTATASTGAGAATVKLTFTESCQPPAASCQVVYEYQDPTGSALVNTRDAASVTEVPGWIVWAGREGARLV